MIRRARTASAALAAVATVAVGLLVSCSEDASVRRPIKPSPTVAEVVTTLAAPTTTVSTTTSTVIVDTTTSVTADTTADTLADSTATTSTTPVTVVDAVRELVLLPDGVGGARFGAEAEGVISYITGVAGLPTADSGWVDALDSPFGACSGGRVRGLQWGQLQLLFGDESSVSTVPGHFFSYRYGGFTSQPPTPTGLKTVGGFALGSTLSQIRAVYPEVTVFEDAISGAGFSISQGGISGTLTDTSDAGQVTVLYGGIGCGE